jgi:hypothetical protein
MDLHVLTGFIPIFFAPQPNPCLRYTAYLRYTDSKSKEEKEFCFKATY